MSSDPKPPSLETVRREAASCQACPLWKSATQTVFGAGPAHARVMLVGEQPGDREDLEGQPFVGPAGALLDRALSDAGIKRTICYVTNTVKHFKWEWRGKRRLHKTPAQNEILACMRWLRAEIEAIRPATIVCLGATAAKALLGSGFRVTLERGKIQHSMLAPFAQVLATVHPSSILRVPDSEERERAYRALVADLKTIKATSAS